MKKYDYLIVGSGLFGATFAYKAREAGNEQEDSIIFGGRLGEYKYYDMAPTIEKVLDIWKK